jgi:ribosomal protein S6--L-glutamate ligase
MRCALISLGSLSSKWIFEALKKYFKQVDFLELKDIRVNLGSKEPEVFYKDKIIKDYDCIYARGSFKYAEVLKALNAAFKDKAYMPLSQDAYTIGHDKILSHILFQKFNIPTPKTYLSSSPDAAKGILKEIQYPVIMKLPRGTHGKGVMVADSFASASSLLDTLNALGQPFLIQEYIESNGEDIRAIVVGNKIVASMKRIAKEGEKRANAHAGGSAKPIVLDTHTANIAIKAAKALESEICAIDILDSIKGPLIIEGNLSPGLQMITNTTKIDIADEIAKFLYNKSKELSSLKKKSHAKEILKELELSSDTENNNELITNLVFKNDKLIIPKIIYKATGFNEDIDVVIKVKKGELVIKKFS